MSDAHGKPTATSDVRIVSGRVVTGSPFSVKNREPGAMCWIEAARRNLDELAGCGLLAVLAVHVENLGD